MSHKVSVKRRSRLSRYTRHTRRYKRSIRRRRSSSRHGHLRKNKTFRGGFGPGAGPVGYAYQPGNVGTWPGVAGFNSGQGNHYAYKGTPSGMFELPASSRNDPATYQSGGGILPQDLVNLGRSVGYGLSSFASKTMGSVTSPVNPWPTKDQGISANYKILESSIPDLNQITTRASMQVAKI